MSAGYPPFLYFRSPKSGHPNTQTDSSDSEHTAALVMANIVQRSARPGVRKFRTTVRAADPAAPHVRRVTYQDHAPDAIRAAERAPGVRSRRGGQRARPHFATAYPFQKSMLEVVAARRRSSVRVRARAFVAVAKSLCVWRRRSYQKVTDLKRANL